MNNKHRNDGNEQSWIHTTHIQYAKWENQNKLVFSKDKWISHQLDYRNQETDPHKYKQ